MRKLTDEKRARLRGRADVFMTGGMPWNPHFAVCEVVDLLNDLDAADEEIVSLHRQVDHDQQLIVTMAPDAKEMRRDYTEVRTLLERVVSHVGKDALTSELICELQELGILDE